MAAEVHDVALARLGEVGQRYTAGRRALVERLVAVGRPVTVGELVAAGDGDRMPQSSVYRNLAVLEQAGVVHRIVTTGEFARFELAEDLTEHHHHLICSGCGAVEDFTAPPALERTLDRALAALVGERGFRPSGHRLDLVGTCRDCG